MKFLSDRSAIDALQQGVETPLAVAKHGCTKAVPFRLILPFLADRDLIDGKRLHGRQSHLKRQGHAKNWVLSGANLLLCASQI
jgi:hypothetical protein